jgi:hypothetical protein
MAINFLDKMETVGLLMQVVIGGEILRLLSLYLMYLYRRSKIKLLDLIWMSTDRVSIRLLDL